MARHRAEAPWPEGSAAEPATTSIAAVDEPSITVRHAHLVTVPLQRADAGTGGAVIMPVTRGPDTGSAGPIHGVPARRRPRLAWWSLLACALFTGLAFVPVSRDLVLPATVISYGEDRVLSSPAAGIVAGIWVGAGDWVEPGDRLLSIEPPTPAALIEERRNWNRLKWQEARQLARIAGQARLARPEGLTSAAPDTDLDAAWSEHQRLLAQGLDADRAMFDPLMQTIERLDRELAEARALLGATGKQLKTARARLGRAAALRDRNVIYDDGVYTEQLFDTLTQITRGLRKELAAQEKVVATAQADLADARDALARSKVEHAGELEAALTGTRRQLDALRVSITVLETQTSRVEVRSDGGGSVQAMGGLRVGGEVEAGEALITLRVPGGKAVLEAAVEPLGPDPIRPWLAVRVILPGTGPGAGVEYAGRVTHVAPLQRGLLGLTVEIDTPDTGRAARSDLSSGLTGEAIVPTRQRAFRYLWRWLVQAGLFERA